MRCGDAERTFALGNKTYGGRTRYAKDAQRTEVHLIANGTLADVEMAQFRFMQRDLLRFRLDEVEKVRVVGGKGSKTLIQRNRRDRSKAFWVDESASDRRNELYGNWLSKVFRLRAMSYLGRDEEPQAAQAAGQGRSAVPDAVVTLHFESEQGAERLQLQRVRGTAGAAATWFARTRATTAWVSVPASIAKQVADDVPTVLGVEQPDSAPAPGQASATAQ